VIKGELDLYRGCQIVRGCQLKNGIKVENHVRRISLVFLVSPPPFLFFEEKYIEDWWVVFGGNGHNEVLP